MAAIINTNVSSLTAQRNLTTSQSSLSQSIQRLSSGMRINSAKDDAAGLAISERLNLEKAGLDARQLPAKVIWFKDRLAPKAVLEAIGETDP